MPVFDITTEQGARADERLRTDTVAWLTTVDDAGLPDSSPVWFVWNGDSALIFSEPGKKKVRNIEARPGVSLHLDGDGHGGSIVTMSGTASVGAGGPRADQVTEYVAKYEPLVGHIGMDMAGMAAAYSVPIHVRFSRGRAWGLA